MKVYLLPCVLLLAAAACSKPAHNEVPGKTDSATTLARPSAAPAITYPYTDTFTGRSLISHSEAFADTNASDLRCENPRAIFCVTYLSQGSVRVFSLMPVVPFRNNAYSTKTEFADSFSVNCEIDTYDPALVVAYPVGDKVITIAPGTLFINRLYYSTIGCDFVDYWEYVGAQR